MSSPSPKGSCCAAHWRIFEPPTLYRRRNSHGFAVLRDCAARNVHAVGGQKGDDAVVGQDVSRGLVLNHFANAITDGLRRMRLRSIHGLNGSREKIFELEDASGS